MAGVLRIELPGSGLPWTAMRYSLLLLAPILLCSVACQRSTMLAVPDRGPHAYRPQAGAAPTTAAPGAEAAPVVGPLQAGERRVLVAAGERLFEIAEREGCDLWWLIVRNDLVTVPVVGDALIVP